MLVIVGLVGLSMATGVAGASPVDQVLVPITMSDEATSRRGAASVEVVEGDHLWKISARHLGSDASNEQIAPYWGEVVSVNTPKLLSGDPDLIYPGEIVEMPAIP